MLRPARTAASGKPAADGVNAPNATRSVSRVAFTANLRMLTAENSRLMPSRTTWRRVVSGSGRSRMRQDSVVSMGLLDDAVSREQAHRVAVSAQAGELDRQVTRLLHEGSELAADFIRQATLIDLPADGVLERRVVRTERRDALHRSNPWRVVDIVESSELGPTFWRFGDLLMTVDGQRARVTSHTVPAEITSRRPTARRKTRPYDVTDVWRTQWDYTLEPLSNCSVDMPNGVYLPISRPLADVMAERIQAHA